MYRKDEWGGILKLRKKYMTEGTHTIRKTTRKKTGDEPGWMGTVMGVVLTSIRSLFDGAVAEVEQSFHAAFTRIARQIAILCLGFLGITFLLFGFAKMLNTLFQVPGIGESIVGVMFMFLAGVLALFTTEKK